MRVIRRLLALWVASVLLAVSAAPASALEVRGFHAYDAGRHITFKWTVCTSSPVRVQTIVHFARSGSYQWRRLYNTGRYRSGCSRWVMTTRDRFLNGEWQAYIAIGPNRLDGAASPTYYFFIG